MKTILIFLALIVSISLKAQNREINISKEKYSQLIFPSKIKNVFVSVDSNSYAMNIIDNQVLFIPLIDLPVSNMIVFTEKGDSFNLDLRTSISPSAQLVYSFESLITDPLIENIMPKEQIDSAILFPTIGEKDFIYAYNSVQQEDIELSLGGLFYDAEYFYFNLTVGNKTSIAYDINFCSIIIEGKVKKNKHLQNSAELPIVSSYYPIIGSQESKQIFIKTKKLAISNKHQLKLFMVEKQGQRNITLILNQNVINQSRHIKK